MPRPPDTSWGFDAVIDFVSSDAEVGLLEPLSPRRPSKGTTLASGTAGVAKSTPSSLGNFAGLFERLGISLDKPTPPVALPVPIVDRSADTINPDGQDDVVPSLTDDLGDSGDADDSLDDDLEIALADVAGQPAEDPVVGMSKRSRRRRNKARRAELQQQQAAEPKPADLEASPPKVKTKSRRSSRDREASQKVPGASAPVVTAILQRKKSDVPHIKPEGKTRPLLPPIIPTRQHPIPAPQPSPIDNLAATLSTQYTTNSRPPPYHQLTSGFVTPVQYIQHSRSIPLANGLPAVTIVQDFGSTLLRPPHVKPVIVPGVKQPIAIPNTKGLPVIPNVKQPLLSRSREDRDFQLLTKLMSDFPEDRRWLLSPMRLTSDQMSPQGLHVFVDASNILFGFRDMLKKTPGCTLKYGMSFDCLALLMERRRPVAKRVYAGSTRESDVALPAEKFAVLAGDVGYQVDIYEQVYKVREDSKRKEFFKKANKYGWAKAMQMRDENGSDSETSPSPTALPSAPKWVEQGVDESIHLKMCQSIIDAEVPSTIVLATGDGAAAEYSDGFLANVERALKKGWKVELVSWKQALNRGYTNKKFRAKWGDSFRIIELDAYLHSVMDCG